MERDVSRRRNCSRLFALCDDGGAPKKKLGRLGFRERPYGGSRVRCPHPAIPNCLPQEAAIPDVATRLFLPVQGNADLQACRAVSSNASACATAGVSRVAAIDLTAQRVDSCVQKGCDSGHGDISA